MSEMAMEKLAEGGVRSAPREDPTLRVALLLSTEYFEDFYGRGLGLERAEYLSSYRNDWSWDWCTMLRRAGVQCSIYVPTLGPAEHVMTADGFEVRFLPLSSFSRPWRRFPFLARSPVGRYAMQAANTRAFLPALRAGLAEDRIDVLCVQEYWTARFDILARRLATPVVAVDQGVPDRHELKLLKRRAFARSAGVVVQTNEERRKVAAYGGRVVRIPNAVDTDTFSPGPAAELAPSPTIVCVGRLHDAQKRLSDVVRALPRLPANWRLEIAGTGPDRPMLEVLAQELGVADQIRYLGFVSDPHELCRLYRRATVFALPSAWEGLPMVLLEAMSCGTPVVGSDIAAIAEVIEPAHTGLLVATGDHEELARALLQAREERETLGRAARERILATYDQAVVGPRLTELLASAARRSLTAR
jgi:glycosyltransferase involved in cell wall biosynthesis